MMKRNIDHLRLVSHSLNTKLVQHEGLETALRNEAARLEAFTGLRCTVTVTGEYHELTADMELLLFRIGQEALQNALKHAQAKSLCISLHYGETNITMRIADDGKGIDPNAANKTSLGMTSMRQRATMLGGTLNVRSSKDNGTEVCVEAPYQN